MKTFQQMLPISQWISLLNKLPIFDGSNYDEWIPGLVCWYVECPKSYKKCLAVAQWNCRGELLLAVLFVWSLVITDIWIQHLGETNHSGMETKVYGMEPWSTRVVQIWMLAKSEVSVWNFLAACSGTGEAIGCDFALKYTYTWSCFPSFNGKIICNFFPWYQWGRGGGRYTFSCKDAINFSSVPQSKHNNYKWTRAS